MVGLKIQFYGIITKIIQDGVIMSEQPVDKEELKEMIRQIIREELTFEAKTESVYTGGFDDGVLYKDAHTIEVIFDNQVLATFSI
jgi:hypothetical protein